MESRTDERLASPESILDRLESAPARPTEEIAALVGEALALAARLEPRSADSATLDRAAADALRASADPEALGAAIPLDDLLAFAGRISSRLESTAGVPPLPDRQTGWNMLDLVRRRSVTTRIARAGGVDTWADALLRLIEASHLTVGPLFRRRVETYGSKLLFEVPGPRGIRSITWRQAGARVDALARGLLSLGETIDDVAPVAILSENRLDAALLDLACLTSGIVNVMLPAASTEDDVGYMLGHARARTIVISNAEQWRKVRPHRGRLDRLRHVIVLERGDAAGCGGMSIDELASREGRSDPAGPATRGEAVGIDDLATVMYTSGTTGNPKGIQFTQRNIVFKRFARGLAIPEIGEDDVFLCYLPLFHTFGRFLELLGCVFWGAKYCFLDSPSIDALVHGMQRHRPTVFISVPKKWIQTYEAIHQEVPPDDDTDEKLAEATRRVTGGNLRWGLSAAGHLDAEVFRFFQRNGIELMSGFGMTEATGGITMTPPGSYRDDSLGVPLPGIDVRLDDDGEMLIRGPYVMSGYLDPPDGESVTTDDGWFRTGDLMERDPEGHYRLVDRKKEIYKNIKGETIAPQRIENLFRDFESVRRVFLVGDHREYNTALIHPSPDYSLLDFASLPSAEVKSHFRSIVSSVNAFLAPYERIVDFAIIDRDLDPEREELTPKGTPRRKNVEKNFAEVIRLLYRRANIRVGDVDLVFPNWLFQALGITAQDLQLSGDRIVLPSGGEGLCVRRVKDGTTRVGSALYRHPKGPLQLGVVMTTPHLWLGNEDLVRFAPLDPSQRVRDGRASEGFEWVSRPEPFPAAEEDREAVRAILDRPFLDLMDLHRATVLLGSDDEPSMFLATDVVRRILEEGEGQLAEPARLVLTRTASTGTIAVRRRAFCALAPADREARFPQTLRRFLAAPGVLLDGETRAALADVDLSEAKLDAVHAETADACRGTGGGRAADRRGAALLRFVADYGAAHPTKYRKARSFLVRMMLFADRDAMRREAGEAAALLQQGFRSWLGPTSCIGVDPETGQEYRWEDVVTFGPEVPVPHRERILSAVKKTALLREAVFLFSIGAIVRLTDVPPGGVLVKHLGTRHGKAVYRISVHTRYQGSFELAVNLNETQSRDLIQEEIRWLILCGEPGHRYPLVEEFGGYWEEQDLWSEEFVAGDTLDRAMARLESTTSVDERMEQLWPFFAWSAMAAYVDFWNRSGRSWEISDPSAANVIVPTHDYQTGSRIVSVSARRTHAGVVAMLRAFVSELIEPSERAYPRLAGLVDASICCSSLLETVGEDEGLDLLRDGLQRAGRALPDGMRDAISAYVAETEVRGFVPMRLHFASQRYLRWAELSPGATPQACARTLQELYETYGLQRLAAGHPEVRVRFFRDTVFSAAPEPLASGLDAIIRKLRRREVVGDAVIDAIAELRGTLSLGEDEDYFLTRLSFPYLRPEDAAGFVQTATGGRHQSEMVVTLEDHDGNPFRVRHALNPKEVGRLHRLFLAAKLDVQFRPEHHYLVAINDRAQIIGGIYYDVGEDGTSAHLEKIVVADRFRKKGVADALMHQLFNRLRSSGARAVTTGFFRPEYFYAYGFSIEKQHAGLVKSLD